MKVGIQKEEVVCGKCERRYKYWFAFVVFLPIILMAGFRGTSFADSGTYAATFLKLPTTLREVIAVAKLADKDNFFYFFAGIIKLFIGKNVELYFLILASIQGLILLSVFRKYSSRYLVSVFLFLASTDYIAWMFNGVRQFLAVTIIFAATGLMLKKKYVASIAIIIFASLFHQSALIMIPIFLIAQGDAWNKKTIVFIIAALFSITFIGQFTDILDSTLSNTQYAEVITDYTNKGDDGTNPLRGIIYSVPAILAFAGRKRIKKSTNVLINFCVNSSLIVAAYHPSSDLRTYLHLPY